MLVNHTYHLSGSNIQMEVLLEDETIWLTIDQMATLYGKSRATVNEHILNIFKDSELAQENVMRKIGISDFSTKPTNYYNFDLILSLGYRIKSPQTALFRVWAMDRIKS